MNFNVPIKHLQPLATLAILASYCSLPHSLHFPPPLAGLKTKKKKIVVKYSLWYLPGIGSRTPMDTKIHWYKFPGINGVVQWSFVSMDSASVDSTNPRWNSAYIWFRLQIQKANCAHT